MEVEPSHCKFCGNRLVERENEGRERKYCTECERFNYRNPKPVAAVAVVRDGEILLVKRGIEPGYGKWSLPAGFIEYDEHPEAGAVRELEEETGLEFSRHDLELLEVSFEERLPGQHVVATVYLTEYSGERKPDGDDDALDASFWDLEELKDSDEVLRDSFRSAIKRALE